MARRSPQWPKVAQACFERDRQNNSPCALCGRSIDYSLGRSTGGGKDSNPKAYEPDHIIPFHEHPEYELDMGNVQATHAGCNRSKHDRAGINLLGQSSEDWWN